MSKLMQAIAGFKKWAAAQASQPSSDDHWESDYEAWPFIYDAFVHFLETSDPATWDEALLQDLLYIIARDHDLEFLVKQAAQDKKLLFFLARHSLLSKEPQAKCQLAAQLKKIASQPAARELLESFLNDDQEPQVRAYALLLLAQSDSGKTEDLCQWAWDQELDPLLKGDLRAAVLEVLAAIKSPLLAHYLELAKKDARPLVVAKALQYENKDQGGSSEFQEIRPVFW